MRVYHFRKRGVKCIIFCTVDREAVLARRYQLTYFRAIAEVMHSSCISFKAATKTPANRLTVTAIVGDFDCILEWYTGTLVYCHNVSRGKPIRGWKYRGQFFAAPPPFVQLLTAS